MKMKITFYKILLMSIQIVHCVLGDGSLFDLKRDFITKKCELINDMISDWEDFPEIYVPLPLIPNYQRMKNIIDNTKDLSIIDLINKANDSDYLNYQDTFQAACDQLSQMVELGPEDLIETIVENTVPTVLSVVLSRVRCLDFIKNNLSDIQMFPLPYHLDTVIKGCGKLEISEEMSDEDLCKILTHFTNINTDNERINMMKQALRREITDDPLCIKMAITAGVVNGDIALLREACAVNEHDEKTRGTIDSREVCIAAGRGHVEAVDFLLNGIEDHGLLNHLFIKDIIHQAYHSDNLFLCKRLAHKIPLNKLSTYGPLVCYYLIKQGFDLSIGKDFWHRVLKDAIARDDTELCREILTEHKPEYKSSCYQSYRSQDNCDGIIQHDSIVPIDICCNKEIMHMLLEAYPFEYTVDNIRSPRSYTEAIIMRRKKCVFGNLVQVCEILNPKKMLEEALNERQGGQI